MFTDQGSEMLDDLEAVEGRLTNWERNFIAALQSQLESDIEFTDKQWAKLEELWETHCDG